MVKEGHKPELIIIAGPNGSGKTSVTKKFLHHEWAEGTIYINPDEVANEMFGDWNSKEAVLNAANYCAAWREKCLEEKESFVFETVMSADDKVQFIIKAKNAGFFVRLFFISTASPKINASRIADRVMKGGHDVPISKIISRYYKSIENCKAVSSIVDRLYVYDNSVDGEEAKLQFRLTNGIMGKRYVADVPEWAQAILPEEKVEPPQIIGRERVKKEVYAELPRLLEVVKAGAIEKEMGVCNGWISNRLHRTQNNPYSVRKFRVEDMDKLNRGVWLLGNKLMSANIIWNDDYTKCVRNVKETLKALFLIRFIEMKMNWSYGDIRMRMITNRRGKKHSQFTLEEIRQMVIGIREIGLNMVSTEFCIDEQETVLFNVNDTLIEEANLNVSKKEQKVSNSIEDELETEWNELNQANSKDNGIVYESDINCRLSSKWINSRIRIVANNSGIFINSVSSTQYARIKNFNEGEKAVGSIWIKRPDKKGWREIIHNYNDENMTVGFIKLRGQDVLYKSTLQQKYYKYIMFK